MDSWERLKYEMDQLRTAFYYRLSFGGESAQTIAEKFHCLYFESHNVEKTWKSTSWMGVPVRKCPLDLWKYQEMIYELRPDVIIETGTQLGGSAYYFASLCDLVGNGRVITIDIDSVEESISKEPKKVAKARPVHPRLSYLLGSSTSQEIVQKVRNSVREGEKAMVVLDSDHRKTHVLDELRAYAALVSVGSYLVVEDTNVNGHPILPEFGPGPHEAVEEFLKDNKGFVVDRSMESHLISFNAGGFLRRVA